MTDTAPIPFSSSVLDRMSEIRRELQSDLPLPGFVAIDDFLAPALLEQLVAGLRRAEVSTYCSYSTDGDERDIRHGFHEPRPDYFYVTVHQRPTQPVPELEVVRAALRAPAAIAALSEMTGLELSTLIQPDALTCWGPGSFIGKHTDFGNETKKLVVSLSLTERWLRDYGGVTSWQWHGRGRKVEMIPKLNTATLFVPHVGSVHWVDPVLPPAPPKSRFTWTLYYR